MACASSLLEKALFQKNAQTPVGSSSAPNQIRSKKTVDHVAMEALNTSPKWVTQKRGDFSRPSRSLRHAGKCGPNGGLHKLEGLALLLLAVCHVLLTAWRVFTKVASGITIGTHR